MFFTNQHKVSNVDEQTHSLTNDKDRVLSENCVAQKR